jgi:hypothetical protein
MSRVLAGVVGFCLAAGPLDQEVPRLASPCLVLHPPDPTDMVGRMTLCYWLGSDGVSFDVRVGV